MKIKKSKCDTIINILCLIMLGGIVVYLITNWGSLPERVPMHHNLAGAVDRWGSKYELLILPVITWGMFLFISVIDHFPQIWNTGITVTEKNKERVYRTLKNLITTTKFLIVCIFTYLTLQTSINLELSAWFLPVFIVILLGDMIFWIWKLVRLK